METPSKDSLYKKIKELLTGVNLVNFTSKKVRTQLSDHFKVDLNPRKKEVDDIIMNVISDIKHENEASDSTDMDSSDSELEDTTVIKKSTISNGNSKKRSSAPSMPTSDEALALQIHSEENGTARRRRASTVAATHSSVSRKKRASTSKPKTESSVKRETGYLKSLELSDELADYLGESKLPRHDVVKRLWAIAREKNLFDPKNKQFVLCDPEWEKLFNKKRIRMFGIMKHLTPHFITK